MAATEERPSAGFWLRAGAFTLDGFLLLAAFVPVQAAMVLSGFSEGFIVASGVLVSGGYFTLLTAACGGQTLGKMCGGVAVVGPGGREPGARRAFGRWLAYGLSLLPAGAGFLLAALGREKRALHDLAAGTRVVRVQELGLLRKTVVVGAAFLPFLAGLLLGALSG